MDFFVKASIKQTLTDYFESRRSKYYSEELVNNVNTAILSNPTEDISSIIGLCQKLYHWTNDNKILIPKEIAHRFCTLKDRKPKPEPTAEELDAATVLCNLVLRG